MKFVDSPFGPGMVGVIAAHDQARYHHLLMSLESLHVPHGSVYAHGTGCNPARNSNNLVKMLLERPNLQWLWIMGDDHCFEPDCLMRLLALDKPLAVPMCARRSFPYDPVVLREFDPTNMKAAWMTWEEVQQHDKPFVIQSCGTAGLLVKRHVFEKLHEPWFRVGTWGQDELQEDLFFTWYATTSGFQIWADPDNFIGHIMSVVLFPKRDAQGRFGVAGNIGGYKQFILPPTHTAKKGPNGELQFKINDWNKPFLDRYKYEYGVDPTVSIGGPSMNEVAVVEEIDGGGDVG